MPCTRNPSHYQSLALRLSDRWQRQLIQRFFWRCPALPVRLDFYRQHLSPRHLDICPGNGFYPKHCMTVRQLSLLDPDPLRLQLARRSIGPARINQLIEHDLRQPFPAALYHRFESVSLFDVLHQFPTAHEDVIRLLTDISRLLTPHGGICGTLVSPDPADHRFAGRWLLNRQKRGGRFSPYCPTALQLADHLKGVFQQVSLTRCGGVILFSAACPWGGKPSDHSSSASSRRCWADRFVLCPKIM